MSNETKSMENSREHLIALANAANQEIALLLKGNKSAGARARKVLQNLKTHCHELRKAIIDHVKTLPKRKVAPSSSFKKKTVEVQPVVDKAKVEDVKEPEPVQEVVKPKRVRKAIVKKIITNPSAEQQLVAAAKRE